MLDLFVETLGCFQINVSFGPIFYIHVPESTSGIHMKSFLIIRFLPDKCESKLQHQWKQV